MNASSLFKTLRAKGVKLKVDGDELTCLAPKGSLTDDLREEIRTHKAELLSVIRGQDKPPSGPARGKSTVRADESIKEQKGPLTTNVIHQCHVSEGLELLSDESTDCCVTSPPYWQLRNYSTAPQIWGGDKQCNHTFVDGFCQECGAWKGELGQEPTPDLYVCHLCDVFDDVNKKLKAIGSCWVVIGDTYNSHSARSKNVGGFEGRQMRNNTAYSKSRIIGKKGLAMPDKCLVGIPARFQLEMMARGWILRNIIIWHKPNCMPSSVKDRFTVDFEYLFFFSKSPRYYFEQQKEPCSGSYLADKRNKRCVWTIPTQAFKGAHFAPYPEKLIEIPILAGCPKGGVVLDPFAGTATTSVVAARLGRRCIAIELNPDYFYLAKDRLREEILKINDMLNRATESTTDNTEIEEKAKNLKIIYEPKGEAREYAPLAASLYKGCAHGCAYCYGPKTVRKSREAFRADVHLRKGALKKFKADVGELKGDDREVLLSFTTDPYQPLEMELGITREAIKALIENDLRFTILTKGGTRAVMDFDLLEGYDKASFGSTIVFTSQDHADKWEPNAPSIRDRIIGVEKAHARGIRTWVSLEPVIDPGQALELIRQLHPIVDHWKVGKLNHHPAIEKKVDWIRFREEVTALLDSLGADYYLKKSLAELQGTAIEEK